jgi:lipopolysaccharide/colanic/teichoic acid biosynthesis glycosyltransferase
MKRVLDLLLLGLAIPFIGPLMLLFAVIKFIFDGRPIFYNSMRIGYNKKPFVVYKFRTMTNDRDLIENEIFKLGRVGFEAIPLNNPVYTKIGRIFERFQIVELPQLLNILNGDMSFVGYRPLPLHHVDKIEKYDDQDLVAARHRSKPGLTGFAQLSGKLNLDNHQRLSIEVAENMYFSTATPMQVLSTYLLLIFITILYVFIGNNRIALKLRKKCINL